jgi:hypothetical protein
MKPAMQHETRSSFSAGLITQQPFFFDALVPLQ